MKAPAPKLKNGHLPHKLAVPWRSSYKKGYRNTWRTSYGPGENLGYYALGAGAFGADSGIQYTPPTGYTLSSLRQVTSDNQSEMSVDGPAVTPSNRIPAGAVPVAGTQLFAPPVGWWVALIQASGGSTWEGAPAGFGAAVVWISPDGQTHAVTGGLPSAGSASAVEPLTVTPTPGATTPDQDSTDTTGASTGFGLGTIVLVAGVGYLIYKLFVSKSPAPRTARAR